MEAPEVLTTLDAEDGEMSHRYPQFLPNGKADRSSKR